MDEKPTLITNMIQYTPFASIMNLVDGTNVTKGDLLFDEWGSKTKDAFWEGTP
jgi:hypothetical protein